MINDGNTPLTNPNDMVGPHHGPEGVDKAPGEEQHEGPIDNPVADSQKGKQQVDADVDNPGDGPADQS